MTWLVGSVVYVSIGIVYLMNVLFSSKDPESFFGYGWMLLFVIVLYPYMMYMELTGKNRKPRSYVNVESLKKTLERESSRFTN